MTQAKAVPVPTAPTLAQQNNDFTAEGAPPPGKVSGPALATPDATGLADPRAPLARPANRRSRRRSKTLPAGSPP